MKRNPAWRLTIATFLITLLTGCTAISHSLSGEKDLKERLTKRADRFQQALYWGDVTKAASYIHEDNRSEMQQALREKKDSRRIIESELTDVELNEEDSDTATVSLRVKYYKIPNYVVQERFEDQTWEIHGGIWFLKSRTFRES